MKYSLWVIKHKIRPTELRFLATSETQAWNQFIRQLPAGLEGYREMWDVIEVDNQVVIYVEGSKVIGE